MTKEEAWKIIEENRDWNSSESSPSLVFHGIRTLTDDVLDARRRALCAAWAVVGGQSVPKKEEGG